MDVISLKRLLADNDGTAKLEVKGIKIPVMIHTIRADYMSPTKNTELFCTIDGRKKWEGGEPTSLGVGIKKVIFNEPATIVIWEDGVKTVVKTQNGEDFDPEKGLAMAIAKRALGNTGSYFEQFKKWIPKEETNEVIDTISALKAAIEELHNKLR